jgi:hypothetical protein
VKFLLKIMLLVFLFVQSVPTLVCLIDNEKTCSISLMDEDGNSKEDKEFKTEFIFNETKSHIVFNQEISNKISNDYLIKDYKIDTSVDIMPPKI